MYSTNSRSGDNYYTRYLDRVLVQSDTGNSMTNNLDSNSERSPFDLKTDQIGDQIDTESIIIGK